MPDRPSASRPPAHAGGSTPNPVGRHGAPGWRHPAILSTQVAATGGAEDLPGRRAELAEELASALLAVGRTDPATALGRADALGVVGLAEAWRGAEPISVPGLLWALHLLRTWCQFNAEDAARLYCSGRAAAPADDVVAGVPDAPVGADLAGLGDALLLQAYAGELGSAGERAAALLRVVAVALHQRGARGQAARARTTAGRLAATASAWRAGRLH